MTDQSSSGLKRPSTKSRKSSGLRTSFGPSHFASEDDGDTSSLVTPKRTNLSRLAIQRNAEKRTASDLPLRAGRDEEDDRPSYSKDYLQELKQSTPSTPKDLASLSATSTDVEDLESNPSQALDIASKFGANLSRYRPPTAIPTDSEIKEKKERRARLAKEGEFISLDDEEADDDEEDLDENVTRDDTGRLILKPKEKYAETRLIREDEDMLEGFDDFTTDGKINFGRKAEREAAERRKLEMASMIADAEGQSEASSGDDSDAERNAAFEVAQTRHGTYASRDTQGEESARPQTPPRIVPLPQLDAVVDRLRKRLQEMQTTRTGKMKGMQALRDEKTNIGEEEVRVQSALKDTGERYQKLREEISLRGKESEPEVPAADNEGAEGNGVEVESDDPSDMDDYDAEERPGLGNAGLGSTMRSEFAGLGARR